MDVVVAVAVAVVVCSAAVVCWADVTVVQQQYPIVVVATGVAVV